MPFWNKLFGRKQEKVQGPASGPEPIPGTGFPPTPPPATPPTPPEPRPESRPGSGSGQGMGPNLQPEGSGEGPGGQCVCPGCGTMAPHETGTPCYEKDCPNCGQKMTRSNTGE